MPKHKPKNYSFVAYLLSRCRRDRDGLRVLEATDVRGLRFRAVFIAGMIEDDDMGRILSSIFLNSDVNPLGVLGFSVQVAQSV